MQWRELFLRIDPLCWAWLLLFISLSIDFIQLWGTWKETVTEIHVQVVFLFFHLCYNGCRKKSPSEWITFLYWVLILSPKVCLLTSIIPPPVISLLLPYLDLASLLHLEATCRLLQEVVSDSGEYPRRFRRLKWQEGREEINEETRNSAYCKQQLIIHSHKLSRQKHFLSDHRITQNISFPR